MSFLSRKRNDRKRRERGSPQGRAGGPRRPDADASGRGASAVSGVAPPAVSGIAPPAALLKPGREASLARGHPWVFSGAIGTVIGEPAAGESLAVHAHDGRFLAWAAWSPSSQIRARVLSRDGARQPDAGWLREQLAAAIARRGVCAPEAGLRLVNAEADGLPGLIVDRYADTLVLQLLSAGAERWRGDLVAFLPELAGASRMFERSDAEVRSLEGMEPRSGPLSPPDDAGGEATIREHGIVWRIDVAGGQKTGFYLDQRDNRRLVGELARDRDVLNAFCYTGGFTLNALAGGARSVLSVDSSGPALDQARRNLAANPQLPSERAQWRDADVFAELRALRDAGRRFDLIVLDPPKFAPTARLAEAAARGYKDINLGAFKLLNPGGLLATFSCSGGVSAELFQKIVAGAAADAGVSAVIAGRFQAAADHPVRLEFPEGEYLKGLLLRRSD